MCRRIATFVGLGLPALLLLITGAGGQQGGAPNPTAAAVAKVSADKAPKIVEQTFPPNGVMETAWKVEWDNEIGFGLVIKNAWFKKAPDVEWMQVIGDARVGDIFVPYQPGTPRYWDIAYNFKLSPMSAADAGPFGKLLTANNGGIEEACVCEEVRERGPIWKNNFGVRRGHAMVLWACLHAVNYRYLIEYDFQDDGCIVFKMGSTGRNLQGREWLPHMHNYYWRVNVNIGGNDHNTAYLMETTEPMSPTNKLGSVTTHKVFNDGKEGFADWDPYKFTMLRVASTKLKSSRGEPYAYDVMPMRPGVSRHLGDHEECTHHDFWVTKNDPKQLRYRDVAKYCNNEDIVDSNIVIWHGSSMFHEPHSEDGVMIDGVWNGATIVSWAGFTLRPNNVFDHTPLFPNPKEPVQPAKKKGKGE